ncbi:DUF4232 domain-containing protein [Streptomyces sp. NPDC000618]|uniref:DUF4232 domain-containing protein n=1 Tax=Streptomyces sp. NPDC000618 TaxID=3154265 RepID=UPI00332CA720
MRIRRTRHLLALTALTALALTACENGTGVQDEGASQPASSTTKPTAAQPTPATDATADAGTTTGTGTGTTTGTGSGTSTTPAKNPPAAAAGATKAADDTDPANRVTCNGSNTKVTAQTLTRPLNHMLLTVTNTGSKMCDLYYYPALKFDGAQSVPPVDEDTQPQAVTTLAPGESGYAGVRLSAADGSGEGGTTSKNLTIYFQGRNPGSDGGASAKPSLPAGGVYYDSSLTVTYWQQSMQDVLSW